MGLPRKQLIALADESLTLRLHEIGYELDPDPGRDDLGWIFDYVQYPGTIDHKYRILSFQPSGLGVHDLFDIAVNLSRWNQRSCPRIHADADPSEISNVRLSPCLWKEDGGMDLWWHFLTEQELREAYQDILAKLLDFGIPFLNNPESSFAVWLDRCTGHNLEK